MGRLTFALADRFNAATGVDLAPSMLEAAMLEAARLFDRTGDRCRFVVNAEDNLGQLPGDSFDLVYSRIVLVFEMYGVPRETVESGLARVGATLLDASPDESASPEWDSFHYFVTR